MWRQGDIYIAVCSRIPEGAHALPHRVLAEGEMTGHSHRVSDPAASRLYRHRESLYLEVVAAEALVVHDEHRPIALAPGIYRVWRQREYSPEAIRTVRD